MDTYLERSIPDNIRHRYNRKLFRLFVDSNIPFNAISSPFFEDFISDIRAAYRFPSRQALATDILIREYSQIMLTTQNEIQSSQDFTLGLDGWTDTSKRSLVAFLVM